MKNLMVHMLVSLYLFFGAETIVSTHYMAGSIPLKQLEMQVLIRVALLALVFFTKVLMLVLATIPVFFFLT